MGKATALTAVALALSFFALGFSVCNLAHAGQFERSAFRNVSDRPMPAVVEQEPEAEEPADDSEPIPDAVYEEPEPDYVGGQEWVSEAAWTPSDAISSEGLTREGGVNYHDGRRETYYSSTVLLHKDTADWTLDDEGFYRTDEGHYVVAASDMEMGTVFEGSMGKCVVLDTGCPAGTTDYYVNSEVMR